MRIQRLSGSLSAAVIPRKGGLNSHEFSYAPRFTVSATMMLRKEGLSSHEFSHRRKGTSHISRLSLRETVSRVARSRRDWETPCPGNFASPILRSRGRGRCSVEESLEVGESVQVPTADVEGVSMIVALTVVGGAPHLL